MLNEVAAIAALVILGWASWRDIKTRRVARHVWRPGFEIGLLFLVLHGVRLFNAPSIIQQFDGLRIGISLGLLVGLGLIFAWLRLFGWADAKAFILLGLLVPLYPTFQLFGVRLPLERSVISVFSFTVVSNGLLLTLLYPLYLAGLNLLNGTSAIPWLFLTRTIPVDDIPTTHGKLVTTPSGETIDGLDLDALRMYLRWRDATLEDLRNQPDRFRYVFPRTTHDPTDGRVLEASMSYTSTDPWSAEAFLREHDAYGTSPDTLREGLETVATEETVLVMPGIPLLVSLFLGLLTALTFGDIIMLFL